MNTSEILDLVRNKLTLPRVILQKLYQMSPQYELAIEDIDELIRKIKKEIENEDPNDRPL